MSTLFKPFDVVTLIDKDKAEWVSRGPEDEQKGDDFLDGVFQVIEAMSGSIWICNDGAMLRTSADNLERVARHDVDTLMGILQQPVPMAVLNT